jgi:hypothetical protein
MRNIFSISLVLMASTMLMAEDQTPDSKLPMDTSATMERYNDSMAILDAKHQADLDHANKVYAAQKLASEKALIIKLRSQANQSARNNDLDGAVAITKVIAKYQKDLDALTATPVQIPEEMVGMWQITYDNGGTRTISIDENGNVLVIASAWDGPGFKYTIIQDPKTNDLFGHIDHRGQVEVYTIENGNLKIAHWEDGSLYGSQPNNRTGVGIKIQK